MRQVRHDLLKDVHAQQKGHEMSEDEAKRHETEAQKLTDRYIAHIEELLKKKTAEVLEV